MRAETRRRGAALAIVLVALVAMTILATAGIARAATNLQLANDEKAQVAAYAQAQSDLERLAAGITRWPLPGRTDSLRLDTLLVRGGDTTRVQVRRIRAASATSPALFTLVATAETLDGRGTASLPPARRSVAMIAGLTGGSGLSANAAAFALNGLEASGNAEIEASDVAAVRTPLPRGTWYSRRGSADVDGSPDHDEALASTLPFSWSSVQAGGGFGTPIAITASGGNWPSADVMATWPTLLAPTGTVRLTGNLSGRGVLIIPDAAEISGTFRWEGLILVGGALQVLGTADLAGAVFTGLDVTTGTAAATIGRTTFGGDAELEYRRAPLDSIAARLSTLRVVPGTFFDAVPLP